MADAATATRPRIGLLGGSFDPIHLGHLIIAQDAREQLGLHGVAFIPAAQSPHKANGTLATNRQRLEMVRAAVATLPYATVNTKELDDGGKSYTAETISALRAEAPDTDFYWIIGADQLAALPNWARIDYLLSEVNFVAVCRPGHALSVPPSLPAERLRLIEGHLIEISSTEIRQRIADGQPVDLFLPGPVQAIIARDGLYR